jgi:hypothetical protein
MKIRDAIKQLQNLKPDDHIIWAYWENDCFPEIKKSDWPAHCDHIEKNCEWNDLDYQMDYAKKCLNQPSSITKQEIER